MWIRAANAAVLYCCAEQRELNLVQMVQKEDAALSSDWGQIIPHQGQARREDALLDIQLNSHKGSWRSWWKSWPLLCRWSSKTTPGCQAGGPGNNFYHWRVSQKLQFPTGTSEKGIRGKKPSAQQESQSPRGWKKREMSSSAERTPLLSSLQGCFTDPGLPTCLC